MGDMHVMTVRLPKELAVLLKNYAFITDTSINDVVKQALIDHLHSHRDKMIGAAFNRVLEQHEAALDYLKAL